MIWREASNIFSLQFEEIVHRVQAITTPEIHRFGKCRAGKAVTGNVPHPHQEACGGAGTDIHASLDQEVYADTCNLHTKKRRKWTYEPLAKQKHPVPEITTLEREWELCKGTKEKKKKTKAEGKATEVQHLQDNVHVSDGKHERPKCVKVT